MAISLIDNLKIQNKKQNVERDSFVSIADMVACLKEQLSMKQVLKR